MDSSKETTVTRESAKRAWERAAAEAYLIGQATTRARKEARVKWDEAETARTSERQERLEKAAEAWEAVRSERIARADEREARSRVIKAKDVLDSVAGTP